jgi:hypothetical protein
MTANALSLFPSQVPFTNPNGTLTRAAYKALATLSTRVGGVVGDEGAEVIGQFMPADFSQGGYAAEVYQMQGATAESAPEVFQANFPIASGTMALQNSDAVAVTGGTILLATGSFGYAAGNGGVVTQLVSKSTAVTLDKRSGEITMNNAALAAGAIVSFTLTNSAVAATDLLILNHVTTGTRGGYTLNAQCNAGNAVIDVRNNTAGSLSEAIVIRFAVVKAATT